MFNFKVEEEFIEVRFDKYLRKKLKDTSLSEIFKAIRTGKIKVNSKKQKENYILKKDDIISVYLNIDIKDLYSPKIENIKDLDIKEIKENIVYEDENIIIYNKKYNEVMHKGTGHDLGLVEKLKQYLNNPYFNFVNRIDKATSGLVIGGKNLKIIRTLSEAIKNREIQKKYYIIVEGIVKEDKFTLDSYLKKDKTKVIESTQEKEGFKKSTSFFQVIKRVKGVTLLEATLETGRTHQLRVQLSNRGFPILGDTKYGSLKNQIRSEEKSLKEKNLKEKNLKTKEKTREKRMYLHSYYIKINNLEIKKLEINNLEIQVQTEIPKEFSDVLDKFK